MLPLPPLADVAFCRAIHCGIDCDVLPVGHVILTAGPLILTAGHETSTSDHGVGLHYAPLTSSYATGR